MGYLRLYDYISNIQTPTLTQVIQGVDATRVMKEAASQAQIISYLVQKYDTDKEFQDTTIFKTSAIYGGDSLVELNYPAFIVQTYTVNQSVLWTDGNCYICILNTTGANENPTNATYWRLLGALYDLYYMANPYPVFTMKTYYSIGDKVFWKGKVYEALVPTPPQSHIADLQAFTYDNIPFPNVLPDNAKNGKIYWGTGVDYKVTGLTINGVLPSVWSAGAYTIGQRVLYNGVIWEALKNNSIEPSKDIINWQPETWTFGDNRNAQIVECMVWITIRKLSPLISPRNIPPLWENKYNECLTWLQMCAQGDVTLNAPEKQPLQGGRIRFGGTVKQQNGY